MNGTNRLETLQRFQQYKQVRNEVAAVIGLYTQWLIQALRERTPPEEIIDGIEDCVDQLLGLPKKWPNH